MLVITRRKGERILIGPGSGAVEVVVLAVRRGSVRLGFAAPRGTRIVRVELVADANDEPPPVAARASERPRR